MTKGAFENLELPDDFEPMGIFMEGKKDKDGSALVSSTDILEGKAAAGSGNDDDDDDDDLSDDEKDQRAKDKKLEDMLNQDENAADDDDDNLDDDNNDGKNPKAPVNKAGNQGDNPLQVYYKMMVEEGLWEEDEEFDGSEEKFLEVKEKNIERLRDEDINAYIDQAFVKNPDGKQYGKALIAHLASGGKLRDFIDINRGADVTEAELDSEDEGVAETAAENLATSYLQLSGWDAEDIRDFIKGKKEKGNLIDYAKEHMKPYQKQVAKANEDRVNQQKQDDLDRKKYAVQYTTKVNEIISSSDKVGIIDLPKTPKEKKALLNYMLTPIELQDGRQMPQFTADYIQLSKDPEFNVFLASALQNWKNANPKKTTNKTSATDQVKRLLGQTDDTGNNGQRGPKAQQPKKSTQKNWSF